MKPRSGLGWLSPTPRLVVFIVLSTLFTLSKSWPAVLVSFAAGVILLVLGRKYPRAALFACFSAGILTFLGNALFAQDEVLYSFWIFSISTESLLNGLRLGLRIMAMILPAVAFIAMTPLHEYLAAFRGLRIPGAAEMYLTVVLRYVDILWYEIQISMKAMAMRGINWEGSIQEKIPAFRRLMLPLIFRILEHVEGQSLAIDNRGGVSTRRENLDLQIEKGVSFENVYVRYDQGDDPSGPHAIEALDLELKTGDTTVLLGRTGAGKTSLMLLSTGLIPHSIGRMKGDVTLFGANTRQTPLGQLGRIARIVLTSAVQGLVGLTVRDELMISLRVSPVKPADAEEAMMKALESVGLEASFLDRLTLGLSGGEMQRVALASAVVAQPLLLALDDVTMQLDPRGKREVIEAMQTLGEERITTLLSDSQVHLLAEAGDRFLSLEKGRITRDAFQLEVEAIEGAGLRIPQMLALSRRMGIELPVPAGEAVSILRARAGDGLRLDEAEPPFGAVILQAEDLAYAYPNGPLALKGIQLSFRRGEFAAILGSNGSGKTTAALLLAGAMAPTGGRILIEGEPFDRSRHRGYVGYVFQEPSNGMVTMRVDEELAFGPQMLGWEPERVRRSVERELERFNLPAEAVPLNLQPADARKVSIAATLSMQPRLVILDEPTNNLDAGDVDSLMLHLKELQREGTTIVLITHDIEVALAYADRLIVMSGGQVRVEGPTRTVAAQPDALAQCDVLVTPVVEASLALWPEHLPALTVEELAARLPLPSPAPIG